MHEHCTDGIQVCLAPGIPFIQKATLISLEDLIGNNEF